MTNFAIIESDSGLTAVPSDATAEQAVSARDGLLVEAGRFDSY